MLPRSTWKQQKFLATSWYETSRFYRRNPSSMGWTGNSWAHIDWHMLIGTWQVGTEAAEVSTAVAGALDVDVSAAPLELPSTLVCAHVFAT